MTVAQFIDDCKKDLAGQGCITARVMGEYKNLVWHVDEILEAEKPLVHRFKKAVKELDKAAVAYMTNETSYAEALENLATAALFREAEAGLGTGFLRFSLIAKELASHRKTMCENFNNMVLFPLNSLLKGDMNKIGDMKKPCEESWKEFKVKGVKKDKAKDKNKEIVLYRINPSETSEETERERRMFMYTACEYLTKANDVKVKKGVELVQHLIDYYHAQLRYFNSGIDLLKDMGSYFEGLASELLQLKSENEEEKKALCDLKNQLKTILQLDPQKEVKEQNYKLHGHQGDKAHGGEKSGILLKRSEGVRKQWQKRYCVIRDGQFTLAHNQQTAPSVNLNLLTCQVKPSVEKEKKLAFALVAHNRTYHFQSEDEKDYDEWISVLSNAREEALNKAFGEGEGALSKEPVTSITELTQGIISELKRMPGNDQCVDCNAFDPSWLSTNLGVLVCIECSGIHRELGVHVSRIRSLTLDRLATAELLIAKAVGNSGFNEIMEAELECGLKPCSTSPMEVRKEFIQQKYVHKKYTHTSGQPQNLLQEELIQAVNSRDILAIIQLYANGVDFTSPMPDYSSWNANGVDFTSMMPEYSQGSALHYSIAKEDLTSIHIVDFMIQNCKNVNFQNSLGNTALHLVALSNKTECAKLLVRGGVKLDIVNKEGKTALTLAQDNGHTEVAELLLDACEGLKTGKFDQIKIDWGLQETEDIYATPVDLSDLKVELRDELEDKLKKNLVLNIGGKVGPISRSVTPPTNIPIPKTTAVPTPEVAPPANTPYSRHSQAYPSSVQVLPTHPPPPLPERSHGPPPPPARKVMKTKIVPTPLPTPLVGQPGISSSGASLLSTSLTDHSITTPPPVLSTFNPKSTSLHPSKLPEAQSPGPPPTPPARSTSFNPRCPEPGQTDPSLPRPDRPPPPAPQRKSHSRNVSEGDILTILENESSLDNNRSRTNSAVDSSIHDILNKRIAVDPDAPPLPPPRPKQMHEVPTTVPTPTVPTTHLPSTPVPLLNSSSSTTATTTATVPLQRTHSAKRIEKVKYRRAKALYDCDADHEDELSFVEGEIIIMVREADPDWWFGEVEGDSQRNGVFPISFVHVLTE